MTSNPYQSPQSAPNPQPAEEEKGIPPVRIMFLVAVVLIGIGFRFIRFQAKAGSTGSAQQRQQFEQMRQDVLAGKGGQPSRMLFGVDGPKTPEKRGPEEAQPTRPMRSE